MLNLALNSRLSRFLTMLVVSLLAGALVIQCQPLRPSGQAANNSASQTPDGNSNQGQSDSQPVNKIVSPSGRAPVAIVYEFNPWAMVIGSDSPSFALYSDGLVIFTRRHQDGKYEYASVTLSEPERDALVSSLPAKEFFALEQRYETTMATDQPTTTIILWDKGQLKSVSVYGGLRRTDNDRKEAAPAAFIETYEKLKGFESNRAAPWMPEKIELMIWPYETAGDALPWPKDWPDTKHLETKKRGDGRDRIAYSIYLSQSQYETLKARLKRDSPSALLIDGRKWAFSFRFPLPLEEDWRKR
jgi:hypothetical protein